ncbi:MAG TPA: outer membrane beta-barrel domain-containing protein [Polyangia bacterium]|jgi:outer membrane beta-barrel protein|nr:outer membrane beta-barrel domain-containing protein [Polyangia bacterium]
MTIGAALAVAALSLWSSAAGAVAPKPGDRDKETDKAGGEAPTPAGQDACVDENVKADLFAKRQMRGTRERLFQQTNRHEIMVQGGYYVSDLFDGNYVFGAAYAYHMTEDLAVEASGGYTRIRSTSGVELERIFSVLGQGSRRELMFNADLIWVPAHGKLRIGGSIDHFDLYLAAGAGVIDSVLSSDIAGNGGFGLKFFIWKAFALRIDVRDYVYRQQLLSQKVLVNDLTTTLGVSLYLPIGE